MGSTNSFGVSRSARAIYENRSSNFRVTGHSPGELIEMVQYVLWVCGLYCFPWCKIRYKVYTRYKVVPNRVGDRRLRRYRSDICLGSTHHSPAAVLTVEDPPDSLACPSQVPHHPPIKLVPHHQSPQALTPPSSGS